MPGWCRGLNLVTYAILVDAMWLSGLPADLQQVVIGTTRDFVENNWAEAKALDEQTLQTVIAKGGRFSTVKEDARQEICRSRPIRKRSVATGPS